MKPNLTCIERHKSNIVYRLWRFILKLIQFLNLLEITNLLQ